MNIKRLIFILDRVIKKWVTVLKLQFRTRTEDRGVKAPGEIKTERSEDVKQISSGINLAIDTHELTD